jgi:hypothetical protein
MYHLYHHIVVYDLEEIGTHLVLHRLGLEIGDNCIEDGTSD